MNLDKTLKLMRNNKRDWSMKEITCIAKKLDIHYSNNGSSHYVFKYEGVTQNLSIPDHKDIHPDYITQFLRFIDKVEELKNEVKVE